ncbi:MULTISPECIES: hypothetical protein [Clostridium]|nr:MULTISPECIES: hypothetical protein [Clostridium]MBO0522999.1 hypothetical protein [Clostridium beijerinckii]
MTAYENSLNIISLKYQHFNLRKVGIFILALMLASAYLNYLIGSTKF